MSASARAGAAGTPGDGRWHRIGLVSAALLPAALVTDQNGLAELLTLLLVLGYARHLWRSRAGLPWKLRRDAAPCPLLPPGETDAVLTTTGSSPGTGGEATDVAGFSPSPRARGEGRGEGFNVEKSAGRSAMLRRGKDVALRSGDRGATAPHPCPSPRARGEGISIAYLTSARASWRWAWSWPALWLAGLWVWMNLAVSPFAPDPAESLRHSLPWFRLPVLAFALGTWVLRDRRTLGLLTAAWGLTLLAAVLDGLWQLHTGVSLSGVPIHGGVRLTGPLDRPNIGGFTARLGLPLLAAGLLLLPAGRRGPLVALLAAAGLGVVFVLLTGERSASLVLLVSLALALGLVALRTPAARLPVLGIVFALAAVATALVATSPRLQARLAETIQAVSGYPDTVYGQLLASSLVMSAERPLTGYGIRGFRVACPPLAAAGRVPRCDSHPHNLYAEWMVECGWVGLLGFVAFVLAFGRHIQGGSRPGGPHHSVVPWLLAALCIVLFPLQATQSFFSNWPALVAWASLGFTLGVARIARRGTSEA